MDGNESRQLRSVESVVSRIRDVRSSPWFVAETISYTVEKKDQKCTPRPEEDRVCGRAKVLGCWGIGRGRKDEYLFSKTYARRRQRCID